MLINPRESEPMIKNAVIRMAVNIGVALAAVLVMFFVLFAYSGVWPPMVVVESSSMQHSDLKSSIGVIDTGDIVIVKKARGDSIITYIEGVAGNHRTYGDYGDVIIYTRGADSSSTPIIHRAFCRIIYNATGGGFDIPSLSLLPESQWRVLPGGEHVWWNLKTVVEIYQVGYLGVTVRLDIANILQYFNASGKMPHGGLITMGDHNFITEGGILYGYYDQISIFREPVKDDWIRGKARGELPWFGLLKLWFGGDAPANIPENSKTNLIITITIVVLVPILLDATSLILKSKGTSISMELKRFFRKNH